MLSISNLCKSYPAGKGTRVTALAQVSLNLEPGMFGLLGPNGAGKSSLMRTIATLQQADSGQIQFDGEDIVQNPGFMRARLGYLPQAFDVYPGVSAFELMDYLAKLKGINDTRQRRLQINDLLERVNLDQHKHQAVSRFSGGMKQRFGIAQALLKQPDILVVDEPTAGLDPEERNRFHNLLVDISTDKVVLLSTHIVEDVSNLCTQMAILSAGRVVKQGSPQQLINEVAQCIWQIETDKKQSLDLKREFKVVSQRLYAGRVTSHVFSIGLPAKGFVQVQPDLEDAYFVALKTSAKQGKVANTGEQHD